MSRRADRYTAHLPAEFARPNSAITLRTELLDDGEVFATSAPATLTLPAHRAALLVDSPLAGALVFIDGKQVGRVPVAAPIPVEPGRLRVTLRAGSAGKDMPDVTQEIEARPGEIAHVTLALAPRGPSALAITRTTLVSAGGVLLLGGIVLAGAASASARNLEGAIAREAPSGLPMTDFSAVRGFDTSGRAFAIASITSLVVGGVAAIVGAALYIWPRRAAAAPR